MKTPYILKFAQIAQSLTIESTEFIPFLEFSECSGRGYEIHLQLYWTPQVLRASGIWYIPYFVVGIFFCSFYLLNLVLAVVYISYEQEMHSMINEVRKKSKIRLQLNT